MTNQQHQPPSRRKLVIFALAMGGLSLAMYLSFIAKVAINGP